MSTLHKKNRQYALINSSSNLSIYFFINTPFLDFIFIDTQVMELITSHSSSLYESNMFYVRNRYQNHLLTDPIFTVSSVFSGVHYNSTTTHTCGYSLLSICILSKCSTTYLIKLALLSLCKITIDRGLYNKNMAILLMCSYLSKEPF